MFYIIENYGWAAGWILGSIFIFLRYAMISGLFFALFYILFRNRFLKRKIQRSFPAVRAIKLEIKYSALTTCIFAVVGLIIYGMYQLGITTIYLKLSEYGTGYVVLSVILLIFIHDSWFYWMHRLMHHPKVFTKIHRVHHLSRNPTPWAALSFHPLEALIEIGFLPVAVLWIPLHPSTIFIFSIWALLFNVVGHLGFEILPRGSIRHPLFRWFNTPTHHNLHHQKGSCNYGLYFNLWDTLMNTNHPNYHEIFDNLHSQNPKPVCSEDSKGR